MPLWAVGEEKAELWAGLRCCSPSRTGERGEWLPGSAQTEDAVW